MELRQLEYFRAIVDAGTISGAARVLHMTQPPLSLSDQNAGGRASGSSSHPRHEENHSDRGRKNTV